MEQQDAQVIPGLPEPLTVVLDDDLSSESIVARTGPRKQTHINLVVPANSLEAHLLGHIHQLRTVGPQAQAAIGKRKILSTRGCGLSWDGNNPALSQICSQHLNCRLHRTPQVPPQRASYRASNGNASLSPLRIFLFMMLRNFIYKQKSMQANLNLPQPAWRT